MEKLEDLKLEDQNWDDAFEKHVFNYHALEKMNIHVQV